MLDDDFCMHRALEKAGDALDRGEFPVGCVISDGDRILCEGARLGTSDGGSNESDHAEIVALQDLDKSYAADTVNYSTLTLYSTLEPCLMCFGAILIRGIGRVVYACEDVMGGGTRLDRSHLPPLYRNHQVEIVPYLLREKSVALLHRFFKNPTNHYWAKSLLANYLLNQSV